MGECSPASARRVEPSSNSVKQRTCVQRFIKYVCVNVEVPPNRVVARKRFANTVDDGLVVSLFGEGAEDTVPYDENSTVVSIDTVIVLTVMYAVVRGRYEYPIEPTEFSNELGVHPVLVQQIDERDGAEDNGWNTEDSHRQIKGEGRERAGRSLA